MSKTTVRVVAHVVALPQKVEEVKSILIDLVKPTRRESGCIQYELLQNHSDPTDFVFTEEWESEAQLNAPLPHFQATINPQGKRILSIKAVCSQEPSI